MVVDVTSNIDTMILLRLDRGTKLIPQDSSKQDMIVTKTIYLPVYPGLHYSSSFYAMCGQIHDGVPTTTDEYSLAPDPVIDRNLIRLTAVLESEWMQDIRGQAAIWAYTDNADAKELTRYGANDIVLRKVVATLDKAGVICKLNPTLPVPETEPTSNLTATAQVNPTLPALEPEHTSITPDAALLKQGDQFTLSVYWVYGAGLLTPVLVFTIVILIRKRSKFKSS